MRTALRVFCMLSPLLFVAPARAADEPVDEAAKRQPKDFAIVFNMGYSSDKFPNEKEPFEAMIKTIRSAHFNVILCRYEPWRAEICKKHDMKIFVDLLVDEHHVYKNVEGAKKLCESLKGNETVFGYHLWSDIITRGTAPGRTRDVKSVHEWDPTHPAYVGCKTMNGISGVAGEDIFGYYDFHWKNGGHFGHLSKASGRAKARNIGFFRYDDTVSGLVGKGNPNRVGYTYATSVPFGLKGIFYHYTGGIIDTKTWELDALGKDLQIVNGRLASAGAEIMKLGAPIGTYSGTITRTEKNDKIEGDPVLPGGLAAVPENHWFELKAGEVLVGEFQDSVKRNVLAFVTHNPYAPQKVQLTFPEGVKTAELFNRKTKKWEDLKITEKTASFGVEEAAVELVRFAR